MSDDINLLPQTEREEEKKVLSKNSLSEMGAENFYAPDLLSPKIKTPEAKTPEAPIVIKDIPAEKPVVKIPPPIIPASNNQTQIKKTFDLPQAQAPNLANIENRKAPDSNDVSAQKIESRPNFWEKISNIFKRKQTKNLNGNGNGNGSRRIMDVNLIPIGLDLLPTQKIASRLWKIFFLSLAVVVLGYFGAKFYGQKLIEQEKTITSQLSDSAVRYEKLKREEDKWTAWRDNVEATKLLLERHIYWSNIFAKLEKITLPEVYYTNISATVDGSITMSAVADSYLSVARQYLAYQQNTKDIGKITISGISGAANSGQINFMVSLSFLPDSFFNQTTD